MTQLSKEQIDAVAEYMTFRGMPQEEIDAFIQSFSHLPNYMSGIRNNLPKITDLSNTKCWVGDNEELSEKIQRRAFELGWFHKEKDDHMKKRIAKNCNFFVFVDTDIFCGKLETKEDFKDTPQIEIFPEQILEESWYEKTENEHRERFLKLKDKFVPKDDDLEQKWYEADWLLKFHRQGDETPDECVDRLRKEVDESYNKKEDKITAMMKESANEDIIGGSPWNPHNELQKLLAEKPKVYILQKDLPYIKAGAKFNYCPPTEDYIHSDENGNVILRYCRTWIENAPDWFLPEEKNSLFSKIKDIIKRHCDGTYRDVESWNFVNPSSAPASILREIETFL